MLLQLDFRDRQPLHEQIKEKMKMLIIHGVLQPDEQIPSVRELAQSLTVNPNTIQKAYKNLEAEGFIYSVRAKGNFVAPNPQKRADHHPRRRALLQELDKIVAELMYLHEPKEKLFSVIHAVYAKKEVE